MRLPDAGPERVTCPESIPLPPQVALTPGTSLHEQGFTCCLPIQDALVSYCLAFKPACGQKLVTVSGPVSCES